MRLGQAAEVGGSLAKIRCFDGFGHVALQSPGDQTSEPVQPLRTSTLSRDNNQTISSYVWGNAKAFSADRLHLAGFRWIDILNTK
jgi:hypothetical protein